MKRSKVDSWKERVSVNWYIRSNVESDDGYSDILIEIEEKRVGIVIEVKYAEGSLETACKEALSQIDALGY